MHWTDAAIILSSRKYGESSAVVRVLAREHGVFSGVVRGAFSKNNRGIIQSGNIVSANWQARLSQQLGTFKIELMEAHTAYIMQDAAKLIALTSACAICETALAERHPYPKIFSALHEFIHILTASDNWCYDYIKFELVVLAESGFGLDLSKCAATGREDNLLYVSPKSGRAVCAEAGAPYKEKMLPLPKFLTGGNSINEHTREAIAGLALTGYFLEHSLLSPHSKKLPAIRIRLYKEWCAREDSNLRHSA